MEIYIYIWLFTCDHPLLSPYSSIFPCLFHQTLRFFSFPSFGFSLKFFMVSLIQCQEIPPLHPITDPAPASVWGVSSPASLGWYLPGTLQDEAGSRCRWWGYWVSPAWPSASHVCGRRSLFFTKPNRYVQVNSHPYHIALECDNSLFQTAEQERHE